MSVHHPSVPITSSRHLCGAGSHQISVVRLRVTLQFNRGDQPKVPKACLLDTGAPLCVLPPEFYEDEGIRWEPLPGPWPRAMRRYHDAPCEIGRVQVWLPTVSVDACGPFWLTAKFPDRTPKSLKHWTEPLPVLLGLNFFVDCRGGVSFQCHTSPDAGMIDLPSP